MTAIGEYREIQPNGRRVTDFHIGDVVAFAFRAAPPSPDIGAFRDPKSQARATQAAHRGELAVVTGIKRFRGYVTVKAGATEFDIRPDHIADASALAPVLSVAGGLHGLSILAEAGATPLDHAFWLEAFSVLPALRKKVPVTPAGGPDPVTDQEVFRACETNITIPLFACLSVLGKRGVDLAPNELSHDQVHQLAAIVGEISALHSMAATIDPNRARDSERIETLTKCGLDIATVSAIPPAMFRSSAARDVNVLIDGLVKHGCTQREQEVSAEHGIDQGKGRNP